MFCTGVGKAILAQLPESAVDTVWASSTIQKKTENTIVDLDVLKSQLVVCRQQGYALDNEENEIGVSCIAAPFFDWHSEPIGAVSISGSTARMTEAVRARILPKLLETTAAISRQLGYAAAPTAV